MGKRFIFFLVSLCGISASAAFFNIRQQEKNQLITCGFYLYLTHNGFDCSHVESSLTEEFYEQFLEELRRFYDRSYDPNKATLADNQAWENQLPAAYQTFDSFRNTIADTCNQGFDMCSKINSETLNPPKFQRKKCNSFCSFMTCRDMFTLSSCYAMNQFKINENDDNPICPDSTIQNCLKNERNLPSLLAKKGWPLEWANLQENWSHIFLATSPEPAKGVYLGIRLAEIGGAAAAIVALPFIAEALAPELVMVGSFSTKNIKNLAFAGIKWVKSAAMGQMNKQLSNLANASLKMEQPVIQPYLDEGRQQLQEARERVERYVY